MYATSMKDRLVSAARAKARELQEAAKPGTAAPELEEALDAAEGKARAAEETRRATGVTARTDDTGRGVDSGAAGDGGAAEGRDDDGDTPVVAAS
jgi:1-acyl-sn-glycerol-3-phosphate acyltransferase